MFRRTENKLASDRPAPLRPSLLAHATPLPSSTTSEEPSKVVEPVPNADSGKRKEGGTTEKKIPK
jgi:hypothetical protein